MNGYRLDHGRFIVEGLGRERMASSRTAKSESKWVRKGATKRWGDG